MKESSSCGLTWLVGILLEVLVSLDVAVSSHLVAVDLTINSLQNTGDCVGGNVGLTDTSVQVQYREITDSGDRQSDWMTLISIPINGSQNISVMENMTLANSSVFGVQFRLLQLEHGGGECNCWDVMQVQGRFNNSTSLLTNYCLVRYCGGSASDARGVITEALYFNGSNVNRCPGGSNSTLISNKGPAITENCSMITPRLEVTYDLDLSLFSHDGGGCAGVDVIQKGIEFSIRNNTNDGPWLPLHLNAIALESEETPTSVVIRGYQVPASIISPNLPKNQTVVVSICGSLLQTNEIQFRWIGTADFNDTLDGFLARNDGWALTRVSAVLVRENERTNIIDEGFGCSNPPCSLNSSLWMTPRNGDVNCEACTDRPPCMNHDLTFGANFDNFSRAINISRIALTGIISLTTTTSTTTEAPTTQQTTASETPTTQTTATEAPTTQTTATEAPTTETTATEAPTTQTTATENMASDTFITNTPSTQTMATAVSSDKVVEIAEEESRIQEKIQINQKLKDVEESEPLEALNLLLNLITGKEPVDAVTAVYLLGSILNRFNSTDNRDQFNEAFIRVGSAITQLDVIGRERQNIVGSSLLSIMDQFALADIENLSADNIALQTQQISLDIEKPITTINSMDFTDMFPEMSLQIPTELIQRFSNTSSASGGVRVIAYLYYEVDHLFPSGKPGEENEATELVSGIVSTGLQCENELCPTENLLESQITITIQHSASVKLMSDNTSQVKCMFWQFLSELNPQDDHILSDGQWSDRGCSRSENLSNTSVTVCECNHLTHFAILLSAAPPESPQPVTLSLQIIGYVGVSISLVAMALTIITFLALKSLHTMRNFIHINLCINLSIAQIIFVAGIDQSASDHVPIHCKVIAVLLHYFFLVSFMWMLMEGVILYVVLVRVFVQNKKRYLIAFTIASYGIPLLYLGTLTIPLGFVILKNKDNYGYHTACFMNPGTKFIWVFIAPVIVIILANIGFFIMAATIMWRHQKKQKDNTQIKNKKSWLKSALSLVVIMGLTWVFGVLIVEVEELIPLAYIYTILVAFQGLFIFVIFVCMSKSVREAYSKWWRIKVNESDLLSKYFREKFSTSGQNISKSNHTFTGKGADKDKAEIELNGN